MRPLRQVHATQASCRSHIPFFPAFPECTEPRRRRSSQRAATDYRLRALFGLSPTSKGKQSMLPHTNVNNFCPLSFFPSPFLVFVLRDLQMVKSHSGLGTVSCLHWQWCMTGTARSYSEPRAVARLRSSPLSIRYRKLLRSRRIAPCGQPTVRAGRKSLPSKRGPSAALAPARPV